MLYEGKPLEAIHSLLFVTSSYSINRGLHYLGSESLCVKYVSAVFLT